ncbi:UDP-glucose 4-epimerase family protein [Noviherbaspirillum massiliense]|uniref:UDP-glucose 4-epimerase family protein n=1 Tax=Noviherbaspirillum massiliense TaxID=1465823 RepID=UPI00037D5C75|nr:SDR family oxidoreductase [Noviherbaspirillum massiliense]
MNKILVTGANGFVGSALCDTLHKRGIPHIGAVRKNKAEFQYETGDLTCATDWSQALSGCDVVIHLAARVHVMKDKANDPFRAYREVNVNATLNLAKQAIGHGIRRFVFVSSIKVNGESTSGKPFTSCDMPEPLDPYGQSKLEAERALQALSRQSGMELVIVRPPLIYGPGVRANFLWLMQLVKLGLPLPFKDISNRRSMVALENLVELLVVCANHPKAAGEIFLVSDDNDLSISELIRLIANSMGRQPILLPIPVWLIKGFLAVLGKSAIADRLLGSLQMDIAHTKKTLNWKPLIDTSTAVEKTVSHFLGEM